MKQIKSDQIPVDYQEFVLSNGMRIAAHKRFCLFCKHCTDIYFDNDGPYLFLCNKNENPEQALKGLCEKFDKDK